MFRTIIFLVLIPGMVLAQSDKYLTWTADHCSTIAKKARVNGHVGGSFDTRVIHTDRAINYKLRATWLTPTVIRATARYLQLQDHLTDDQTRALVAEAETPGYTVMQIEIDPNEGSGVIPLDWRVFIEVKNGQASIGNPIPGIKAPELKHVKAMAGVYRRDYAYDIFWVKFPIKDDNGQLLIPASATAVDLMVGIYNKEGRVHWTIDKTDE